MQNKIIRNISIFSIIGFFLCSSIFAGGQKDDINAPLATPQIENPKIVRAGALNGPSGMPMAYLFENHPELNGVESTFESVASADVLLPKLLKGEIDIGILPPNVAAKVYTKNNGMIVIGAVVGQGMLNVITKDTSIKTLSDLKGKTVTVAGAGATPEYMIRFLLEKNGIPVTGENKASADTSVTLDFSIPAAEIAASLLSNKIEYAVVPEPFATVATTKDPSVLRAINIQSEFTKVLSQSKNYPMTVVVVRAEFAKLYPETVKSFLESYKQAIDWTNANPSEAGALVQKHTLGLQAPIATKAIPNAAFVYQSAEEAKPDIEQLLNIFISFAPESIGGSLPDDGFYFK